MDDDKREDITKLVQSIKDYEKATETLQMIPESNINTAFYDAINLATKLLDDDSDSLEWYLRENMIGKNGLEAKGGRIKEMKKIKTLDDLFDEFQAKKSLANDQISKACFYI